MSSGHDKWKLNAEDAYKLLVCETHLGASSVDYQSEQYVFKRRNDGTHLINLGKTWEKLLFAARAIAAVENPAEVCIVSARPHAQRAILKFAAHTGAQSIVGRFVPGSFTNQIQKNFKEPRLIVVSDPRVDHQAISEASYVNIPVISFTNTDSPLKFVDIAIPCNNKGPQSIGLMWWMLAREVLRLRGKIIVESTFFTLDQKIIMPDLYFFRDPEEQKKEEAGEEGDEKRDVFADGAAKPDEYAMASVPGTEPLKPDFKLQRIDDWAAASGVVDDAEAQAAAGAAGAAGATGAAGGVAAAPAPQQTSTDWGAPTGGDTAEW